MRRRNLWPLLGATLLLSMPACQPDDDPVDSGSATRRDSGPGRDSGSTSVDAGPAGLVIDTSGMPGNPIPWSESPEEMMSLCGTLEGNVLRLSELAGRDCGGETEPILLAQRTGDTVRLLARTSPAVEIVSSTTGTVTSPQQATDLLDTTMDEDGWARGSVVIRVSASDGGEPAMIRVHIEHFSRFVGPTTTRAAAFNYDRVFPAM